MLPLRTPAVQAALLGKSDGWCAKPSQAAKFSDPAVRAAYEHYYDKHLRLRREEDQRVASV